MQAPGLGFSSRAHRPQLLPGSGSSRAKPATLSQQQVAALQRYHDQLGVNHLLPNRPQAARQDGFLAEQSHIPARALQHYRVCLTNAKTRQVREAREAREYWARMAAQPTRPTAFISQGTYQSPAEIQARQQQMALAAAHDKYVQNVELISGEFTPLTLYDPVIRNVAESGLMVMGGVGAVRWAGPGLEYATGVRASITTWRAAPQAFLKAAAYRGGFDFVGQYAGAKMFGGETFFSAGWNESLGEVNLLQTFTSAANLNPYTASVGTAAFSLSVNHGFQSVLYASGDPRSITNAKFYAQATTGLLLTKAGAKFEAKMTDNSFLSWQLYKQAMRWNIPRAAYPLLGTGIGLGQRYGAPLTNSVIGSVSGAAVGHLVDKQYPPPKPAPPHPDSPVFLP